MVTLAEASLLSRSAAPVVLTYRTESEEAECCGVQSNVDVHNQRSVMSLLSSMLLLWLFRGRSRKVQEASDSTDAQKKFGDAKSISSDQFFGGRDPDVSHVIARVSYINALFQNNGPHI